MKKKLLIATILSIAVMLVGVTNVNAMTIVLDPGHGGNGAGEAVGASNTDVTPAIYEKDINLKIGLYLKEYLEQYQDVNIIMTRTDDSALTIFKRAMIARQNNADLFVSLHTNDGASRTTSSGVEVWITEDDILPKYNKEMNELGQKIIKNITDLGLKNRGVKTKLRGDVNDIYSDGHRADYYGVICYAMRGTKIDFLVQNEDGSYRIANAEEDGTVCMYIVDDNGKIVIVDRSTQAKVENGEGIPTILIEHAFIYKDIEFLDSDADLKALAEADGKAIVEQYNLKLKNIVEVEDKTITPMVKLDEEKGIAAFVLQNSEDRLTANDIFKAFGYTEDGDKQEILGTGRFFWIGDKKYTVAIYGDVNGNGEITIADAVAIVRHLTGDEIINTNDSKHIAGDLDDNKEIKINDAVAIVRYLIEGGTVK